MSAAAAIPGFTGRMVEANGVRLHCKLGGDPAGPPVLLWHGFLGTSYIWRKVVPLPTARGCAVLVSPTCAATATATSRRGRTATTA